MRKIGFVLCATGVLSLCLGGVGCGASRPPGDNGDHDRKGETSLRGELETKELIKAMEDTVATRDQGKEKLVEALQRVVSADRKIEGLKLTDAEKKALDDKYGARKEDLNKRIEE